MLRGEEEEEGRGARGRRGRAGVQTTSLPFPLFCMNPAHKLASAIRAILSPPCQCGEQTVVVVVFQPAHGKQKNRPTHFHFPPTLLHQFPASILFPSFLSRVCLGLCYARCDDREIRTNFRFPLIRPPIEWLELFFCGVTFLNDRCSCSIFLTIKT